ncbi:MAG TPA: hypothetical protein VFH27_00270 [Longimicrobiaceae bacterium]|nr:hypothetical protein [Longimicrobiaceae bacterium]
MTRIRSALASLLLVMVSLSACATGARASGEANDIAFTVRVNNNLTVPDEVSVFIVNELGNSRLLGSVPATRSRTFRYSPSAPGGSYHLRARGTAGGEQQSDLFTVATHETAVWTLDSNTVWVVM